MNRPFVQPPGDRDLYLGRLRLTTAQKFGTLVYALCGIAVGATAVFAAFWILVPSRHGWAVLVFSAFWFLIGALALLVSVGILMRSALGRSKR